MGRSNLLRSEQILFRSGDDEQTYQRLVSKIASGHGVIRLQGWGLSLVLFICGENNALRCDHRNLSALYYPSTGLTEVLGGRWIALNPAHSPYWPQSKMTGFAKVGLVGGVGQTMARTVARRGPYVDGTRPPVAFVHGNNFYPEEPRTRAYASVAFDATGRMTPTQTEEDTFPGRDGGDIGWIFSSYEIPV